MKIGESANGTGDPNFAAACMAVGIPLDARQPAQVVKCENGRDYCRWFLAPVSLNGRVSIADTNEAWSKRAVPEGNPWLRGFGFVMDFVASRSRAVSTTDDWIAHAHHHLKDKGESGRWSWPRKADQIQDFVAKHPEDRCGYVFAMVVNRDLCMHLWREACEDPRLLLAGSSGHTMLRERAPAWRKKLLLQMIG